MFTLFSGRIVSCLLIIEDVNTFEGQQEIKVREQEVPAVVPRNEWGSWRCPHWQKMLMVLGSCEFQ